MKAAEGMFGTPVSRLSISNERHSDKN